ncbi:MAG: O-antigen ligase family protein [Acidobacteria bacterium]|nr:O-antigen ligase family protein [Acidobacteriota bacterium]
MSEGLKDGLAVRALRALALAGLASSVFLGPVAHGAVLPAGLLPLLALVFTSAAVAVAVTPLPARSSPVWPLVLGPAALAGLGLLTLVPLPLAVVKVLSPVAASLQKDAAEVLTAFEATPTVTYRLSIAPAETGTVVLLALGLSFAALASALLSRSRAARRILVLSVLGSALAQVVIALAGETPRPARLHGSFVNPNNFAGFLQLGMGVASGLVWLASRRGRTLERRVLYTVLAALPWGALAAGIGLSRSRGGFLGAAAGLAVALALAIWKLRRGEGRLRAAAGTAGAVALSLALVFAASVTGAVPLARFLESDSDLLAADGRVLLWKASFAAFLDSPVLGLGLGAFREAFRAHQPRGIQGLVEQAHSEPLQMLVTGGLVGAALSAALLGLVVSGLLRLLAAERHREESALLVGSAAALAALLGHGLFEFNFSIPAIPLALSVLLGAALASGESETVTGPPASTRTRTERLP